jgi:hypothetical protein
VIDLVQNRDSSWALVNAVTNLRVPYNEGNFLTSWEPIRCSRTLLHGIRYIWCSVLAVSNVSVEKGSDIYIIWGTSWNGNGSVGIVTRLQDLQLTIRVSIVGLRKGLFSSPWGPDWFWGPHSLQFIRYPSFITLGLKLACIAAGYPPPFIAQLNNYLSYVCSIPSCLQGGPRDDITWRKFKAVNLKYLSIEVTEMHRNLGNMGCSE